MTSLQCAHHCHPSICKLISKLCWRHLPFNFHEHLCDTAGFFLAKPPKDTCTMRATRMFFTTIVEVSGSSTSFAAKSPARIQGERTLVWQESMGGCCSGGWGPLSHHVPKAEGITRLS